MNRRSAFLCAVVMLVLSNSQLMAEQVITVAVPPYTQTMNILEDSHPAAALLRSLLLQPVYSSRASSQALRSLQVSPDYREVLLTFSSEARFHSGYRLSPQDVIFSIKRCQAKELITASWRIESPVSAQGELFQIKIFIEDRPAGGEMANALIHSLESCPLLEQKSSRFFGETLGTGSNLVSMGPYMLTGFRGTRSMQLQGFLEGSPLNPLELKAFAEEEAALAALRRGKIDLFYSSNQEVISRAEKDETLLSAKCSIYSVVLRKGLHFSCNPEPDPLTLSY